MSDRQLPDGLRRLNKLADLLESEPPENFSLASWKYGTACCAGGFAATHPYFVNEGLGIRPDRILPVYFVPSYDGYTSWQAVEKFIQLDDDEARSLFDPTCYLMEDWHSLKPVINRIRALVRHKTALYAMLTT